MSLVRRKKEKLIIAPRNTDLFVQTVYYQSNPHAFRNLLIILILLAVAFVSMATMSTTGAVIVVCSILVVPAVFAFVSGKKWFSFNSVYDEPLIFEPNALQVGDEYFDIRDMEGILFYIHSFSGFRYHSSRVPRESSTGMDKADGVVFGGIRSEYGDRNELHFTAHGKQYQCKFLLGSGRAWYAIYQIMNAWKMQGKQIALKEEFPADFVEREIAAYTGIYQR